jgi:hypothetical protein
MTLEEFIENMKQRKENGGIFRPGNRKNDNEELNDGEDL